LINKGIRRKNQKIFVKIILSFDSKSKGNGIGRMSRDLGYELHNPLIVISMALPKEFPNTSYSFFQEKSSNFKSENKGQVE